MGHVLIMRILVSVTLLAALALVTYIPQLSLWLPNALQMK